MGQELGRSGAQTESGSTVKREESGLNDPRAWRRSLWPHLFTANRVEYPREVQAASSHQRGWIYTNPASYTTDPELLQPGIRGTGRERLRQRERERDRDFELVSQGTDRGLGQRKTEKNK